ncbi:MAG: response regulator transcription factor [Actinomycetota bacterium]|nr:response regulator transcription factor [Actinomycetota bacterium]
MIRLVLADDSFLVRRGLRAVVEAEPELDLVGECHDLASLLAAVDTATPDVVITDIRMPPTATDEGIQAAARLRRSHPTVGVVLLSQYVDSRYVLDYLRDGTARRAYLLKETVYDPWQLLAAVQAVVAGGSMIDPKVMEALVSASVRQRESPLATLTSRERQVLAHMAHACDNQAIAHILSLSVRAVERHINAIFAKLGLAVETDVHRRVKAVLLFLAHEPLET